MREHQGHSRWQGFVRKTKCIVAGIPVTAAVFLAVLSTVAISLLLVGKFYIPVVFLMGLTLATIVTIFVQKKLSTSFAESYTRYDVLVLVGTVLWVIANLFFSSQHIFTNRDPATYNNAAIWLTSHHSIQIEQPEFLQRLDMSELRATSLGFAANPDNTSQIQAQGMHALPALQALAGWLAGVSGVLKANIVIAGIALLAFYGFARVYLRSQFALFAVIILAISLPFLFAARDSYTEPLALGFIFGGLNLATYASRQRSVSLAFLAGSVLGAAALARIDAYILFAGVVAGLFLLIAIAVRERKSLIGQAVSFIGGIILLSIFALLDAVYLSRPYFLAHSKYIKPELGLLAIVLVLGTIAVWLNWRFRVIHKINSLTIRWREPALSVTIIGFFVVLLSRPLWFVGQTETASGSITRTFSEQTMNWLWWYFGPVVVCMSILGIILVIHNIMRGVNLSLMLFLFGFGAMTLLYLLEPSITGDQPWATRRLLPVTMPGFIFFSLWAMQRLFDNGVLTIRRRKYDGRIIATVLITLSVVSPLFVSYPFLHRRLYVPEYQQISSICQAIPQGAVVVWVGESSDFSVQPTRSVCGNEAAGVYLSEGESHIALLSRLSIKADNANLHIIVGFYGNEELQLPLTRPKANYITSTISYNEIDHAYKRAPRNVITLNRTIFLGVLSDGKLEPLQNK